MSKSDAMSVPTRMNSRMIVAALMPSSAVSSDARCLSRERESKSTKAPPHPMICLLYLEDLDLVFLVLLALRGSSEFCDWLNLSSIVAQPSRLLVGSQVFSDAA